MNRSPSKKIFIDATGIVKTPTGLGQYSCYFLKAILKNKGYHFSILHQSDLPKFHSLFRLRNENVDFLPIQIPVIGPKREIGIFNLRNKINQCNLYHCLSSYLPAFGITIPSVVTIHDLKYLLFPKLFHNYLKTLYYSWIIHRGTQKATRVIAVSEATKRDLINLGVCVDKITVIHEAATICPIDAKAKTMLPEAVRGKSFLLFVGEYRPHKNIPRIIEAHRILFESLGEECPHLVFAGANFDRIRQKYIGKEQGKKLTFLGPVLEDVLACLYKYAIALVFPSLYEGFGLPVLEAMAMGVPVVTSNCSSLPEVAGEAAVLVDPHNANQLADAMMKLVKNKVEREKLKQLGLRRVNEFSWDRTARMTLELYENILSGEPLE